MSACSWRLLILFAHWSWDFSGTWYDFQLYLGYFGVILWDSKSYLIFTVQTVSLLRSSAQVQAGGDTQLLAGPRWRQRRWEQRVYSNSVIAAGLGAKFSSSSWGPAATTLWGEKTASYRLPPLHSSSLMPLARGWKLNCPPSLTDSTPVGKAQGLTATRGNPKSSSSPSAPLTQRVQVFFSLWLE